MKRRKQIHLGAAILTATVTPQFPVAHSDPDRRMTEYIEATNHWLRHSVVDRVALIENSGADLEKLRSGLDARWRHRLVCVPAPAPSADQLARGKGAAEASMLEQALEHLDLPPNQPFAKVTGRFISLNLERSIRGLPSTSFVRARLRPDLTHMDTRFFLSNTETFLRVFRGAGDETDDLNGLWIEHTYVARLLQAIARGETSLSRFPSTPALAGISGTTGVSHFGASWLGRQIAEDLGRRASRKNGLWI